MASNLIVSCYYGKLQDLEAHGAAKGSGSWHPAVPGMPKAGKKRRPMAWDLPTQIQTNGLGRS